MSNIGNFKRVGREVVYKGKIPEGGKRDYLVARIGGNGAGYAGKVYFSNSYCACNG